MSGSFTDVCVQIGTERKRHADCLARIVPVWQRENLGGTHSFQASVVDLTAQTRRHLRLRVWRGEPTGASYGARADWAGVCTGKPREATGSHGKPRGRAVASSAFTLGATLGGVEGSGAGSLSLAMQLRRSISHLFDGCIER
jgi:hypothetical protein